jgi:hypothetical protein
MRNRGRPPGLHSESWRGILVSGQGDDRPWVAYPASGWSRTTMTAMCRIVEATAEREPRSLVAVVARPRRDLHYAGGLA